MLCLVLDTSCKIATAAHYSGEQCCMLATHRCLTFGNEVAGQWTRQQLIAMDEKFCRAMGVPSRWVRGAAQPEMKSAAAAHAVAPHLQELERQNAELRNHLAREV